MISCTTRVLLVDMNLLYRQDRMGAVVELETLKNKKKQKKDPYNIPGFMPKSINDKDIDILFICTFNYVALRC